jgi:ribonuclease BN (tRNA processing enzyme)
MPVTDDTPFASLCVLASGSSGNCSVVRYCAGGEGARARACLIDLGLPPRRTIRLLAAMGLGLDQIDDVLITHLDTDHFRPGWARWLPGHVRFRLQLAHARRCGEIDRLTDRLEVFDAGESFALQSGIGVHPLRLAHDAVGVSAFRLDLPAHFGGGRLGFATDLGRVTRALIDLLHDAGNGVDVLAIESNYCPRMQLASGRPEFLKRRIMNGRGHLSNEEALEAIQRIQPREHVVLLHLSRECNDCAHVAALHAGADYALTIAEQHRATRWVRIAACGAPRRVRIVGHTPSLFDPLPT